MARSLSVRKIAIAAVCASATVALGAGASVSYGSGASASATTTKTFTSTGGEQAFNVPAGVTSLDVVAVGGKGGPGAVGASPGGFGALAKATLPVTPGQLLFIDVGGNGGNGNIVTAGFNGGGTGGAGAVSGGGGGGSTDIRTISSASAGNSLGSRLIVAGGGGGGGGGGGPFPIGGLGGNAGLADGTGNSGSAGGVTATADSVAGAGGHGGPNPGTVNGIPAANFNGSGGGGGGGALGANSSGNGGLPGQGPGTFDQFAQFHGGGGGGGGGGSTGFGQTATKKTISTDTSGVPRVQITYQAGGGSGLEFGKVKKNKKKGTALLSVTVPGSGKLSIGGHGVVHKRLGTARLPRLLAKDVPQAGTYKLKVKAKGAKRAKLFSTGKVKVKAVVTFAPTSGDPIKDPVTVTLKKN